MGKDLGINLGSMNTVVCLRGKGVISNEPTVVSLDCNSGGILQTGSEALQTAARVPASTTIIQPMYDPSRRLEAAEKIIRSIIKQNGIGRSRIALCLSGTFTGTEKRELMRSIEETGNQVFLIDKSIASAVGAGKDITAPDEGGIIVHIGAETTELAAIAGGKIESQDTLEFGGSLFTEAIRGYIADRRHIDVDNLMAERIKCEIGSVWQRVDNDPREYTGIRLADGLPRIFRLRPSVLTAALEEPLARMLDGISGFIDGLSDYVYDIVSQHGILLTGGGALLWGLDTILNQVTGLKVTIAEMPDLVAAIGACMALDSLNGYGVLNTADDLEK